MKDWMERQYDYHIWASGKLLAFIASLPEDVFSKKVNLGFASIAEVAGHLASAEEVWFARLRGETPPPLTAKLFRTIEEARDYMNRMHEKNREYVRNVQDWEAIVNYRNTLNQSFQNTIGDIVEQVINHGTYHRGNMTTMLRFLGHSGTLTDYVVFIRSIG